MKKMLKRNQVIIAALAIMIVVAGYLNLTGNPGAEVSKNGQTAELSSTPKVEEEKEDIFTVSDNGEFITDDEEEKKETEASDEKKEEGKETGGDVSDKDDTPGNAILASTQLSADFFTGAKLSREQIRAKNEATLMGIVNDESISEELKADAISALIDMTKNAETEDLTESLLEAKGYSDVVVRIEEGTVDVILNAAALTETQVAQIEDVVIRKTGAKAEQIVITHAVLED